jgi:hypothetical protein
MLVAVHASVVLELVLMLLRVLLLLLIRRSDYKVTIAFDQVTH